MSLLLRPVAAVLGSAWRRPGRSLAVVTLLALIAFGLAMAGGHLWAAYHYRAARTALDRYHNVEASEHLQACLRVWPNDADVLLLAARTARRAALFDEAEDLLDRCQQQHGRDDNQVLERALLTAERGDVDDVMKFCKAKVEANDATSPLVLEAMARGFLRRFRTEEAQETIEFWSERDPNNTMAILLRGRMAQEHEADTDAANAFRRALELDPELDEARDRLATVLLQTHQAPEALPHLLYLARRGPDDPGLTVRLAQCRDLLGQQDEAVRLLDGVLQKHPKFVPALAERGKLAFHAGQRDEAERWFRKAVDLAPGDATLLPQLQLCLEQSGQTEEARALEPRTKKAKDDLARLQVLLAEEIPRNPRDAGLWYEGGMILLRARSGGEGVRLLENAVRINPRHAKAHEALADVYRRTGNPARAAEHEKLAREAGGGTGK